MLVLENIDHDVVKSILGAMPKKVIALDKLFQENDQLKTNTVLQMKNAEIEFVTL